MNNIVKTNGELELIPFKEVEEKIIVVRGHEVLLDRDVAALYGVETKRINEAVRNNPRKFREGYMFELTSDESSVLRSKISTLELSEGKGRYSKYNFKAFTERHHRDLRKGAGVETGTAGSAQGDGQGEADQ